MGVCAHQCSAIEARRGFETPRNWSSHDHEPPDMGTGN